MSWSNICSAVSSSSQWHALRAQRDAQGWTWETKARESIWGSRLGCARTKGQLGNSFGRCERRRQPVYNSVREKEGERGASAQKKTDKTHYEAAMKDELFKEAPARFRGSVHREKMAVFTYKMFPFWGWLKKPPAIQRDNWSLWNPLTYTAQGCAPAAWKRPRIEHTLWVCHVPFKLIMFRKQYIS